MIKLEITGDKTGPNVGDIEYAAMATSLSSSLHKSAKDPAPTFKEAHPPSPPKNLKTINCVEVFAKPQAKLKTKIIQIDILRTGLRPKRSLSDMGAIIKGPIAHARIIIVTLNDFMNGVFIFKSSPISFIAGDKIDEDMGDINV
jgi:hypothetical protein